MSGSILLVEDEYALRMTLGDRLRKEGYRRRLRRRRRRRVEQGDPAAVRPHRPRRHAAAARRIRRVQEPSRGGPHHAGADADRARPHRRKGHTASRSAPTTTSPSRSRCRSCSPASGRCSDAPRPRPKRRPTSTSSAASASISAATEVTRDGQPVNLSAREMQLLRFFLENPGVDALARGAPDARLGLSQGDVHAHGGRARREPAPEAGGRPAPAAVLPHRAGTRLQVQAVTPMIKLPFYARFGTATAIVCTAAVVVALAVIQYRWNQQASDATGVRLADALQLSMINWHLDLFRNLSEVGLTMRMPVDAGAATSISTPSGSRSGDRSRGIRSSSPTFTSSGGRRRWSASRCGWRRHRADARSRDAGRGAVDRVGELPRSRGRRTPAASPSQAEPGSSPRAFTTSAPRCGSGDSIRRRPALVRSTLPTREWLLVELDEDVLQRPHPARSRAPLFPGHRRPRLRSRGRVGRAGTGA